MHSARADPRFSPRRRRPWPHPKRAKPRPGQQAWAKASWAREKPYRPPVNSDVGSTRWQAPRLHRIADCDPTMQKEFAGNNRLPFWNGTAPASDRARACNAALLRTSTYSLGLLIPDEALTTDASSCTTAIGSAEPPSAITSSPFVAP